MKWLGIFFFLFSSFLGTAQPTLPDVLKMDDAEFNDYLIACKEKLDNHKSAYIFPNLGAEACKADFAILCRVLKEAQTPIYRFVSENDLSELMQREFTAFETKNTYLDLIRAVAGLQRTIGCVHSGWSHSKEYRSYRKQNVRLFPLDIYVKYNQFYVYRNHSWDTTIHMHDEILTINGENPQQIMSKLRRHMVSEGESGRGGIKEIERYFANAYSNFIGNPDVFTLEMNVSGAKSRTVELDALLKSEMKHEKKADVVPQNRLELKMVGERDAIYTIRSFNNNQIAHFGQDFISFTDSVFTVLSENETKRLVIDLRGNTGGWTANGAHLFSYFMEESVPYIEQVKVKKYENYSFEPILLGEPGYLDTFDLKLAEDGLYYWANYPSLRISVPSVNRFQGEVYVVTDELTRSCSNAFASLMSEYDKAMFIGEETVGSQCGSAGMVAIIELPHSNIQINFSTAEYFFAVDHDNCARGIIPNIPFQTLRTDTTDGIMNYIFVELGRK